MAYIVVKRICAGAGGAGAAGGAGRPGPCCRAAYFIFSPRGLEALLHSGVLVEVTRLLYKQFTWIASSTQRECSMQCSQFLECSNAQVADTSNFNHAALSLVFLLFC